MAFLEQSQRILLPVNPAYMALTLVLALLFNLLPWRDVTWLPDMVALVLTFWCVHQPRKIGIGIAWFLGLIMDAGNGALLPGRRVSSFSFEPDWPNRPWPPGNKYEHSASDAQLGLA